MVSLYCAAAAAAAIQNLPPLETDRPDFTEGAHAVLSGAWQVESGLTVEWSDSDSFVNLPELLLRYGLDERTEIRIGVPDYMSSDAPGFEDGFGDASIGAKFELNGDEEETQLALLVGVSLPTAEDGLGADGAIPEFILVWSHEASQLAGQFGAAFPTDDDDGDPSYQATIVYGDDLNETTGWFVEFASFFGEDAPTVNLLHAGFTFSRDIDTQWDIHFGAACDNGPDFFIGAGFSKRIRS